MALNTKPTTATVFGTTTTNDYLYGSLDNDTLSGGVATIVYNIDTGKDTMEGGGGDDVYVVNSVYDTVVEYANQGIDTIYTTVDYTLPAEVENMASVGTAGSILFGNAKDNILDGTQNSGSNTLIGMAGNDTYVMGTGDRVIEATGTNYTTDPGGIDTVVSPNTIDISADNATLTGASFIENVILTGSATANITGNSKSNTLIGNAGANSIVGANGDDTLDGGIDSSVTDTLVGGSGNDTYFIRNSTDQIVENSNEGADNVKTSANYTLPSYVENLTLIGANGITGIGNTTNNYLTGNSGANSLAGSDGNDTLNGASGADTLDGGLGDDLYIIDNDADKILERVGQGTDMVKSSINISIASATTLTTALSDSPTVSALVTALTNANPSSLTITAATTPTLASLVNAITSAPDYANEPFTVAVNSTTGITLTWKNAGVVSNLANLTLPNNIKLTATQVTTGTSNIAEVEKIDISTLSAGAYILDPNAEPFRVLQPLTITAATTPTLASLVSSITSASDYANEPFTVAVNSTGITLTWKNAGVVSNLASLTLPNHTQLTATQATAGTSSTAEVEKIDISTLTAGAYKLDPNALTLVWKSAGIVPNLVSLALPPDALGNPTLPLTASRVTTGTGTVAEVQSFLTISSLPIGQYQLKPNADNVEKLTLTGSADINGTGNELDNIILGNAGNNSLVGGDGNDSLVGGNTTVAGAQSIDTLVGGNGNDILDGSQGSDSMMGGAGKDLYYVDSLGDIIAGELASPVITPLSSTPSAAEIAAYNAQVLAASNEVDSIQLTATVAIVNATLTGYTIPDNVENLTITGSAGSASTSANVKVTGNASDNSIINSANIFGISSLLGGLGNDSLRGNIGVDNLDGGAGNDSLSGGYANDILNGGTGDDTLDGGIGDDNLLGGDGSDTYVIDSLNDKVVETIGTNTGVFKLTSVGVGVGGLSNTVTTSTTTAPTLDAILNAITTAPNYATAPYIATKNATATDIVLTWKTVGAPGVDSTKSNPALSATLILPNNEVLTAREIQKGTSNSVEIQTMDIAQIDTVQANLVANQTYTLPANVENLTLEGFNNTNGIGNGLNNLLTGNHRANALTSLDGNDTLDGADGGDTLTGGAGNDTYIIYSTADKIAAESATATEIDTVQSKISFSLLASGNPQITDNNLENLTLLGSATVGTGNDKANIITGNNNNNTLDGGLGADNLIGSFGDDTYVVDNVGDTIVDNWTHTVIDANGNTVVDASGHPVIKIDNAGYETVNSSVTYTLAAYLENLNLTGTTTINGTGNDLANVITGNSADNVLDGAAGNDTLSGSTGNDTYIVDSAYNPIGGGDDLEDANGNFISSSGDVIIEPSLISSPLTSSLTLNDLMNALSSDSDYSTEAFTLSVNGTTGIKLTWKNFGVVNDLAKLALPLSHATATQLTTGVTPVNEVQHIAISNFSAGNYTLSSTSGTPITVAATTLDSLASNIVSNTKYASEPFTVAISNFEVTTAPLVTTPNLTALVNAIAGSAGFDQEPFSVDVNATTGIKLTWKTNGTGVNLASLTLPDGTQITATRATLGTATSPEVQTFAVTPTMGVYKLDVPTGIDLTWKNPSATTDVASLTLPNSTKLTATEVAKGTASAIEVETFNTSLANNGTYTLTLTAGQQTLTTQFVETASTTSTDIVTAITNATGYANEPFTVTTNGTTGIQLIWKEAGTVVDTASLDLQLNATKSTVGTTTTAEVQTFNISTLNTGVYTLNSAAGGGNDLVQSYVSYTIPANIETLQLIGNNPITATGDDNANRLIGNAYANTIIAGAGNDTIYGGAGRDIISAGAGNDDVNFASNITDTLATANSIAGVDWCNDLQINDANNDSIGLTVQVNNVGVAVSGAINEASFIADMNALLSASGKGFKQFAGGVDAAMVTATSGDLSHTGTTGTDRVFIVVDLPADLAGLNGNDSFDANDFVIEVTGSTFTGAGLTKNSFTQAPQTLHGTAANDTLIGGAAADLLYDDLGGNDTLDGGNRGDTMRGGPGNDLYLVDNTGDIVDETVTGSSGIDTVNSSVSYTLTSNVENLTLTGAGIINGTGNSLPNVLGGNNANNSLSGLAGNDTLDGSAGADTLSGGADNDTYFVDDINDKVDETSTGSSGIDTINSSVTYTLPTNVENLTLTGTNAIDGTGNSLINSVGNILIGNNAVNKLTGGAGDDTLDGAQGTDTLIGGDGNDTYTLDNAGDVVTEAINQGIDTINTNQTYSLPDNVENLNLTGTNPLNGTGNILANSITGNAANNTLDGGAGADTLTGGDGSDVYIVDHSLDVVNENSNEGTDDIINSSVSYSLPDNVEDLTLTGTNNIDGAGNSTANKITGNNANNSLLGGADNDTIIGNAGNDTIVGGTGKDNIVTGTGNDVVVLTNIFDSYANSSSLSNVDLYSDLTLNSGSADKINIPAVDISNVGLANSGTLNEYNFINDMNTLLTQTGKGFVQYPAGIDAAVVTATAGNLAGTAAIDTPLTPATPNRVFLAVDLDHSDTFTASDLVIEITGSTLTSVSKNSLYYATNTITGTTGNDSLAGTLSDDSISGSTGNDTLDGNLGNDTLIGGTGDDTYVVDTVYDVIIEASNEGTDTINTAISYDMSTLANVENLTLTGTDDINGIGNALANTITGNSGNNSLVGGVGNDTISGGEGRDIISVYNGLETATDGSDTVLLAGSADSLVTGSTGNYSIAGVDWYKDLYVNAALNDKIDLTVTVPHVGLVNSGSVSESTFVDDMNSLLTASGKGFVQYAGGFDAAIVNATTGDLAGRSFLAVDLNANGGFSTDDLVVEITGSNIASLTTGSFTTLPKTIKGTNNDDSLVGGANADTIYGYAGNDTLDGGTGGADSLIGGAGDDTYYVDNAGDSVVENSAEGIDTVNSTLSYTLPTNVENLTLDNTIATNINGTGNASNNIIVGNSSANNLTGIDGNDSLSGGNGNDILDGGNGNDTLDGGNGNDNLTGGVGNDTYVVDSLSDVVNEVTSNTTDANDTVISSITLTAPTNIENLTLAAGAGSISGTGNGLNNIITGNEGDNTLDGGSGTDTLVGGLGNDLYTIHGSTDQVTENPNEGTTDTVQGSLSFTLPANVENLVLTGTGAYTGTGNELDNKLTGNTGANNLNGDLGDDTLNGGTGDGVADALAGGLGDDTYIIDSNLDTITDNAGEGTDTIQSSIAYTLPVLSDTQEIENLTLTGSSAINGTGNDLNNVITGNSGINSLSGGLGDDTYYVSTGDNVYEAVGAGTDSVYSDVSYTLPVYTTSEIENLSLTGAFAINATGNDLNNVITGNSIANSLSGSTGNDTLDGGAGDAKTDTLVGGAGNDTYIVDNTSDVLTEAIGGGTDTVLSSVTYTLPVSTTSELENLTLTGSAAISGTGNDLANVLDGSQNSAANTLTGGTGNDTYIVNSNDTVVEAASAGTDTIQSTDNYSIASLPNVENLTLIGTATSATGNSANNTITGNDLGDTLDGGTGADILNGGAGTDTFFIDNASDVINDTSASIGDNFGGDTVDSSLVSYTLPANMENLTLVEGSSAVNATGNDSKNIIYGNSANNSIDGGSGKDSIIAGAGNDTIRGGIGSDIISTGAGNDLIVFASGVTDSLTTVNGVGNMDLCNDLVLNGNSADTIQLTVTVANVGSAISGSANAATFVTDVNTLMTNNPSKGFKQTANGIDATIINVTGGDLINRSFLAVDLNASDSFDANSTVAGTIANDFVIEITGSTVNSLTTASFNTVSQTYTGTASADNWTGGGGDDTASGLGGNDTLNGAAGNDSLDGGAGSDSLTGGDGNDILQGGAADAIIDTLVGGLGNDTYIVDSTLDTITENVGEGTDIVKSSVSYTTLPANVEYLTLTGTTAVNATGNTLDNSIIGNNIANSLSGGTGNDILDGGMSSTGLADDGVVDSLVGGVGDDTYIVRATNDVITENTGEGTDTVQSTVNYTLPTTAEVENLVLAYNGTATSGTGNTLANTITDSTGNSTAKTLAGGTGNDTIYGGAGADSIDGGTGNDSLSGGAGNDTYTVDSTSDVIVEAAGVSGGTDTIKTALSSYSLNTTANANVENLTLTGTSSSTGVGNALNNSLTGSSGTDTLTGGLGSDTLTGGASKDVFVFAAGDSALSISGTGSAGVITGYDSITDYTVAVSNSSAEKLDVTGTASVATITGFVSNGVDSSLLLNTGLAVKSHAISAGLITFDDLDTFGTAVTLNSLADVAAVTQYLQANDIGNAGTSIEFKATISSTTHTYVYTQGDATGTNNSLDTLVDLVGINSTGLAASSTRTAGYDYVI